MTDTTDTTEQSQSRTPRRVEVRQVTNDSDDMEPMLQVFRASDHATFDLDRKVLMFGTLKVK